MGIVKFLAKSVAETVREKRTYSQEENLSLETKREIEALRKKAENGNLPAMDRLGYYYYAGIYVGYNPDKACYWWTEAANRGYANAQYNLGLLYHGNISTKYYDENLAGYWLHQAASNGDDEAYEFYHKHYTYNRRKNKFKRIT